MEMILHTLIAIVALKAAEINRSEVTKKVDTFAPPHFLNSRQITQRVGTVFIIKIDRAKILMTLREHNQVLEVHRYYICFSK